MQLNLLPGLYAVCQLPPSSSVPDWAQPSDFLTFNVDERETTVVCRQELVPSSVVAETDWRCFQVDGILDFSLTGILSRLTSILAERKISVYVVSTFSSDYLMVREGDCENAIAGWSEAGHTTVV